MFLETVELEKLILDIQNQIEKIKKDRISSASHDSLPGNLLALEFIVKKDPLTKINFSKVFDVCKKACYGVLDVLSNPSPEGNLPESIVYDNNASDTLFSNASQLLLSFSWRVVKQAADLLGAIAVRQRSKVRLRITISRLDCETSVFSDLTQFRILSICISWSLAANSLSSLC
jgi:hypothetical protein